MSLFRHIIALKTVVFMINSTSGVRKFSLGEAGKSAARLRRDRRDQSDHYFSFPLLWYFKIIPHFFVLKNDLAMVFIF